MSTSVRFSVAALAMSAIVLIAGTPASSQELPPTSTDPISSGVEGTLTDDRPSVPDRPLNDERVLVTRPTFIIEAIGFTAIDETGVDVLGSDEIYAIWSSRGISAASALFGNVDSGDTRRFHEFQSCMYPIGADRDVAGHEGDAWACLPDGGLAPVQFRVDLYEDDPPSFPACFGGAAFLHPSDQCDNDWIGGETVDYTEAQLLQILPRPGRSTERTLRLNKGCLDGPDDHVGEPGENLCSPGLWEADYDFHYRVTRLADRDVLQFPAAD